MGTAMHINAGRLHPVYHATRQTFPKTHPEVCFNHFEATLILVRLATTIHQHINQ